MNTNRKAWIAIAVAILAMVLGSCAISPPVQAVVDVARGLRSLIPGIQAGLALVKPDSPTSRALDPVNAAPTDWPYGTQTPAQVYTAAGGTGSAVRLPGTGYFHMANNDQIFLTLAPEPTLGATYYRVTLTTYPAFDLSVANTVEEYIVNSAGLESWAWGNLDLSKKANSFISITTNYTDGTSGSRTLVWNSNFTPGSYYAAFGVTDPDPTVTASFIGYRYEESANAPPYVAGGMRYSSHATEQVKGKGTTTDSVQYYTETNATTHSGLTYVIMDKKRKWSVNSYVVTRMQEDTGVGTRKIRSVGEVGTTQYYIDKVDISIVTGQTTYTSTHDVYNTALPRGVNQAASSGTALAVVEDTAGSGTFTGTLDEVQGTTKTTREVAINRNNLNQFVVKMKIKSTGPRAIVNEVQVPLTSQSLSSFSIALPDIGGTFTGNYEAGNLFGSITAWGSTFDVVVGDEGVAINDVLYP